MISSSYHCRTPSAGQGRRPRWSYATETLKSEMQSERSCKVGLVRARVEVAECMSLRCALITCFHSFCLPLCPASTTSTKSQLVLRHEHHAESAVLEQEIDGEATLFAYAAAAALPHMCSSFRSCGRRIESGRRQLGAVCLYVRLHWTQIRLGCQIGLDCRIRLEDRELGAVCLRRRARMPNTPLTKPMSHVPLTKPIACLPTRAWV